MSLFNSDKHHSEMMKYYNNDNYVYNNHHSHHHHRKSKRKSEFFDWIDIVSTALVVVVLLFTFVFRVATIEGESMLNTFHDGERVIISKIGFTPRRGNVVVISRNYYNQPEKTSHEDQPIIKRIIAVEGDTVKIDFQKGVVYVNGEQLVEYYTATPTNNLVDPVNAQKLMEGVTVPNNCVFVLGDNRNNSLDSRSASIGAYGNGMIDEKYILGKVTFRIFPISKIGGVR